MTSDSKFGRRLFLAASAGLAAGFAAGDDKWQIGIYTRPWAKYEYRAALDAIAEAGYKYAGLMTQAGPGRHVVRVETTPEEAATIGEEVRRRGLKTISIWGGEFSVQKSIETGIAGLRRLIDNCSAIGCPNLLLGGTRPALVEPYYKAVAECCPYAVSKHVSLSVKPHGGSTTSGAECRKVVEMVGSKNFGVWYDPGNIYFYSGGKVDPVEDVPSVDGLVRGISIKDFKLPKDVLVTPGTGLVKFPEFFARIRKGGFTHGPLVVECLDPLDGPALVAQARQARLFVERMVSG